HIDINKDVVVEAIARGGLGNDATATLSGVSADANAKGIGSNNVTADVTIGGDVTVAALGANADALFRHITAYATNSGHANVEIAGDVTVAAVGLQSTPEQIAPAIGNAHAQMTKILVSADTAYAEVHIGGQVDIAASADGDAGAHLGNIAAYA
ncbi:hypothetical protein G6677_09280, partial [Polynucleobacter paneuropaeus]|nr:hypothetical protein [Polynucleobacter paneuropaeus]